MHIRELWSKHFYLGTEVRQLQFSCQPIPRTQTQAIHLTADRLCHHLPHQIPGARCLIDSRLRKHLTRLILTNEEDIKTYRHQLTNSRVHAAGEGSSDSDVRYVGPLSYTQGHDALSSYNDQVLQYTHPSQYAALSRQYVQNIRPPYP